MGMNSSIEWTDHTFNPWSGCIRVSPGCEHCYAETLSKRWGKDIWGPGSKRQRTSDANWRKPLQWNKQAEKEGRRYKVFCASMADVFEDNEQIVEWRDELFDLIDQTPSLDWLLLTKRPENVLAMLPSHWHGPSPKGTRGVVGDGIPNNVWLGASVENQEYADKRIPELLKIPAAVRFLSVEPLLGSVNLMKYLLSGAHKWRQDINWVIVGGESGPGARPLHPGWVRKIRDDCTAAGVAYFFKQWGEFSYGTIEDDAGFAGGKAANMTNGGRMAINHPNFKLDDKTAFLRVGKHRAGRLLDGREWNEMPQTLRHAQDTAQQTGQLALL